MDSFQATLFAGTLRWGSVFYGLPDYETARGTVVLACREVLRKRTAKSALASEQAHRSLPPSG